MSVGAPQILLAIYRPAMKNGPQIKLEVLPSFFPFLASFFSEGGEKGGGLSHVIRRVNEKE